MVAFPALLVSGVVVEKLPPAPLSVKVTTVLGTPLPYWSLTETISDFGSLVPWVPLCLFPPVMAKLAGAAASESRERCLEWRFQKKR